MELLKGYVARNMKSMKLSADSAPGILWSIFCVFKPSFLGRNDNPPRKLHATSYLDGLRGVAALFVVFAHYQATFFSFLGDGWHVPPDTDGGESVNNNILQFPIIRTFYSGHFMVGIFFVISGYVLSQKALGELPFPNPNPTSPLEKVELTWMIGLARRKEYTPLLKSLSSSVFRRWLRLMLPALTASFICFLFALLALPTHLSGIQDPPLRNSTQAEVLPILQPLYDPETVTFFDWASDSLYLADPFRFGDVQFPKYDYPLWTMQVEYMGSLIIFVVVLGTSRVKAALRIAMLVWLVAICVLNARWQWCLFLHGVLIADVVYKSPTEATMLPLASRMDEDDEAGEKLTPSSTFLESWKPSFNYHARYWKLVVSLIDVVIFIFALLLGSFPNGGPEQLAAAPGYSFLSQFMPASWGFFETYFFPDIGSMLLVSVLAHAEFLQRIFITRFAQYLGDIGLSIYMLHILVLDNFGNWIIAQCLNATKGLGDWGFTVGMTSEFIRYDFGGCFC